MCLILKNEFVRPKIATKDIIVYKYVEKKDGAFRSFYYEAPIELGKTYSSEIDKFCKFIEKALHSCKNKEDAQKYLNSGYVTHGATVHVIKCIIPKGSSYYEGIFDSFSGDFKCFASDALTYLEEV